MSSYKETGWRGVALGLALAGSAAAVGCTLDDRVEGDDKWYLDVTLPDVQTDIVPGEPNGCDLSGIWIAELQTFSTAFVSATAVAYNWFYYEIDDQGDTFEVTRGWDCGFEVTNATAVFLYPETRRALALRNRQEGVIDSTAESPVEVAPRTGVYRPDPNDPSQCEFSMERWWWLRGAEARFAPPRENYGWSITEAQNWRALPTKDNPSGEVDIEDDGKPGIWLEVTAPIVGSNQRHVVQRDWNQFGPFSVEDGAEEFVGPATFDNQESIFEVSISLLNATSTANASGHTIRFRRITEQAPVAINDFVIWCQDNVEDVMRASRPAPTDD